MTFAEFISLIEEYNLPVANPERFRFMIKDMSAAEFRAHLDSNGTTPIWSEDTDGCSIDMTDGCGNRWIRDKGGAD